MVFTWMFNRRFWYNFISAYKIPFSVLGIMTLAIVNGLITSIMLETIILMKQKLSFSKALNTAIGMTLFQ